MKANRQGQLNIRHPLPTTSSSSYKLPKRAASRDPIIEEDKGDESYHLEASEEEEADEQEVEQFDNTRFTFATNEAWYNLRIQAKVLVEKNISKDADDYFHIMELFGRLGWDKFFELPRYYYKELLREFYANVEDKHRRHMNPPISIVSRVRGRRITIERSTAWWILGVSDRGPTFNFKKTFRPLEKDDWDVQIALTRLKSQFMSTRTAPRSSMLTSTFEPRYRLFLYLCAHTIIPKASSYNEACHCDVYFLDKAVHGLGNVNGLSLGSIIVNHMWIVARSTAPTHALLYARFLTKEFERQQVNMANCSRTNIDSSKDLDVVTCQKLNIPTEFATNLVQEEGTSTQAGRQRHGEGTSISRPPSSRSARSQPIPWKQLMGKLLCMEAKIDARLSRIERHLGIQASLSPEPHQEEDKDGGEK